MATYILQKDLPNANKGVEFIKGSGVAETHYHYLDKIYYEAVYVENNPEWFKLKEREELITIAFNLGDTFERNWEIFTSTLMKNNCMPKNLFIAVLNHLNIT